MTRYPLQPLLDLSGLSMKALRELCPMSGQTYRNARRIGLTEDQADRYACRVGLVPWLVWPHWLEDAEVECADRACSNRFVPRASTSRFCSRTCGNRDRTRRHLARKRQDPEFRAAEAARVKQYRSAAASRVASRLRRERHPEAVRAYQRAYRKRVAA